MRRYRSGGSELSNHPFRSMFDLMLALLFFLILVIIMMVPKNRYLDFITAEDFVRKQVNLVRPEYRPTDIPTKVKKDPIGRQRWIYANDPAAPPEDRFFADSAQAGTDNDQVTLTEKGTKAIMYLADVLKQYGPGSRNQKWYRIDIEGHTGAVPGEVEPWEKSTSMAITVARLFERQGLPAWVLKVSGRGRQDEGVISGERVEIIVEYSNSTDADSDESDL